MQKIEELSEKIMKMKDDLEKLQDIIIDSPEESLSLPILRKDVKLLKEENKFIRSDINRVFELSKWFIATFIAMTIGLLGVIISLIVSKRQK